MFQVKSSQLSASAFIRQMQLTPVSQQDKHDNMNELTEVNMETTVQEVISPLFVKSEKAERIKAALPF